MSSADVGGTTLGEVLRDARRAKGLELSDVSEMTNVRKEYLSALDDGRYQDLPEDVYTKNFVRLYSQAVGLDQAALLETYSRERGAQANIKRAEQPDADTSPVSPVRGASQSRHDGERSGFILTALGSWARAPRWRGILPYLLVVALLVWGALWAFNSLLFPRSAAPAQSQPPAGAEASLAAGEEAVAAEGATASPSNALAEGTVLFSLTSEPAGAEVSLDNYDFPGTTPIENAPVTPGEGRLLRVTLGGYEAFEREIDLTSNRHLSVTLTPQDTGAAGARTETDATATDTRVTAVEGAIALVITAESWLEVYSGSGRGQGQTLLYRNVQEGETFRFDLPVHLHVGNAGGVQYALSGEEPAPLGSSGQIVSRTFSTE